LEVLLGRAFDTPITTHDQSIDRVLAAGLPVVFVFLGNESPGDLGQAMERLAREHAGDLLVAKVWAKDSPEAVRRYQVGRTPALVTVRNGQTLAKADEIGAGDFSDHVAYLLGKGPKPEAPRAPQNGRAPGAGASASGSSRVQPGPGAPRVVTDATFDQEVLRSEQPVLVDFWAPWCGPCRMVEPVVEKLAREMSGRLNVAKVNVDENPAISQRYGVQSIPTMMVIRNGQIVDRWMGALPEMAIRSRIAPHLN
jgi:thioredoxin 1